MAAKKKTGKVYGSKTQFVMSLPHEVSAKDVVARAKAKGLALTEAHVYKIRSTNKSKGAAIKGGKTATKKAAPAKKASKKATTGKGASSQSKRDFVLSMGNAPAAEVLKQAKKAGLGLSKAYLYTIRAESGGSAKKAAGKSASKSASKKAPKKAAKKAAKKKR
jgi:hypothetical protein